MDLYVGRLQTHPAGYGFVVPERPLDGGGDIYISGPHLNDAMHGDRVVVRIERIKDGGRAEGRIIRILERANAWLVGRYDRDEDGMGYVVPFDRRVLMDIFVPPGQEGGASPGRDGDRRADALADRRRAAPSAASPRCSATSTRPASTPRSSSASTAFPTRTRPRRSPKRSRLGAAVADARHPRPHRLPRPRRPSPSTASTRAISTTRSRSRSCRTATTGSACTSPTCRTTCRRAARSTARPTSAARRSISPSAPCTCSRPSWRPGCAA